MKIVKTITIQAQFRTNPVKATSPYTKAIASLKNDESLVISAKEADRWKVPGNVLRSMIAYAKTKKLIGKCDKFSIKLLKSGSYAVIKHSS
jgi:hypothetical protein